MSGLSYFEEIMKIVALLFSLTFVSVAHADVVRPVIDFQCPSGAEEKLSHAGNYCGFSSIKVCSSDEDCGEGTSCLPVSRCVEQQSTPPARPGFPPGQITVVSFPTETGECSQGQCLMQRVCTTDAVAKADACMGGIELPDGAVPAPSSTESVQKPATQPDAVDASDSSSCATVVAGVSASMAGLLGLVALRRRRD